MSRRAPLGRVSQARWSPPLDDRPSPRTTALITTSLGVLASGAAAFMVWAVSVDRVRGDQAPLLASADPSASPPLLRAHPTDVEGAAVLGPTGVSSTSGAITVGDVDAVDDAVGSCLPGGGLRDGVVVRLIAAEPHGQGPSGRSEHLLALELRPPGGQPARYYAFAGQDGSGYFDETGLRSCSTEWQPPLAQLRRTSRFDPHRMHPILHRRMPHEGTDFGAPKGTPVYAAYRGVVTWAGPHGSHGTWVAIAHPDGTETGYAHLSRIALGLKSGDRVRAHQIIGYVGSTGRSTGPHLHFSARKDGKYFDAETLLAHAERGVSAVDRQAFLAAKAEMDRRLDAIPLPRMLPSAPPQDRHEPR